MSVVGKAGKSDQYHTEIIGAVNFTKSKAFDDALTRIAKLGFSDEEARSLLTGKAKKSEGYAHIFKANPNHDAKGRFARRPGVGDGSPLGTGISVGNSAYAKTSEIAFPKAQGVKVPPLGKDEVYLVRYSKSNEVGSEDGVGHFAYAGKHIDDVVNSASAYAKDTSDGFLIIGRTEDKEWNHSAEEESAGLEYNGVLGTKYGEVDMVINLKTGKVSTMTGKDRVNKANPYHDELGRFSTKDRAKTVSGEVSLGHGTAFANSIREEGFKLNPKNGNLIRTFGNGVYLTSDKEVAAKFGELIEVKVKGKFKALSDREYDDFLFSDEFKAYEKAKRASGATLPEDLPTTKSTAWVAEWFKDKGYDGLFLTKGTSYPDNTTYVVFDPKKIKIQKGEVLALTLYAVPPESVTRGTKKEGLASVFKANPYHDELGRFATADSSSFVSTGPKFQKTIAKLKAQMKTVETPFKEPSYWDYNDNVEGMYDKSQELLAATKDQWDSLTEKERNAILGYTGKAGEKYDAWYYGDLNPMVGSQRGDLSKLNAKNKEIVATLDAAIDKGSLPEDMRLYKAIDLSHSGFKGFGESSDEMDLMNMMGHVVKDHAYSSTSASMKVAQGFQRDNRVLLQLDAPKGSKGVWVGGSSERTAFEKEHEFILPRECSYIITGVKKIKDDWGRDVVFLTGQLKTP